MLGIRPVREQRTANLSVLERIAEQRSGSTWAGVSITPEAALSVPWVWSCLQLTAGVISTMPVDEYVRRDGVAEPVSSMSPLLVAPSAQVSLEDWIFQHIESMIMHGGAWGAIVARDRAMHPTQVELVSPTVVTVRQDRFGGEWSVRFDGKVMDRDEVWYVPGRTRAGSPFGIGLLDYMLETVAVGVAARKYGAQFFGDGAHPTMVVTPPTNPGEDGAKALKARLLDILRGNREPLIVPNGTQVEPWQTNPSDAALVEVLRQNATDGAQFFLVPPELVGGVTGDSATYANVEARVLNLLAFGVAFWLTKWERAISRQLPRPRFVKLNEAAIIRTDEKTKIDVLATAVRAGLRTQNEGRVKLDLSPRDDGDRLNWPPNTTTPPKDKQP
jgi:HK97 family phage portal protein